MFWSQEFYVFNFDIFAEFNWSHTEGPKPDKISLISLENQIEPSV